MTMLNTPRPRECGSVSKEGYVCALYVDHTSEQHKDKHMHHSWVD